MLVKNFIEQYKKDSKVAIASIWIKTHISFKEKYSLLEQVKYCAIDTDENNISYYDHLTGDFLFDIALLKFYTDLEFSDESMDELDELKRIGAFDEITEVFYYDHLMLEKYFKEKVQSILNIENNTQSVLNREIIKVANKAIQTLDAVAANVDKKTINKVINAMAKTINEIVSKYSPNITDNKPTPFNVLNK